MNVTLYTKPSCVQCNATHRALAAAGIEHTTIDITGTPTPATPALTRLQAGPVVVADTDHWSGFRPDRIKTLSA
ncbi:NrdH-redoxin [Rhodococcus hoagii]|nr:NrdH-redoxin [Prescottella equi]